MNSRFLRVYARARKKTREILSQAASFRSQPRLPELGLFPKLAATVALAHALALATYYFFSSAVLRVSGLPGAREAISDLSRIGIAIFILFTAAAVALIWRPAKRLRKAASLARKIMTGDYEARMPTNGPRDEIHALAESVNEFSNRFNLLTHAEADLIRMEKELQSAEIFQERFFPLNPFSHPDVKLAGRYIPATQCAGDWWHYRLLGNKLVFVQADVTGHGFSAALITASIHAAFHVWGMRIEEGFENPPLLESLIEHLNEAAYSSGQGDGMATCVAGVLELDTGALSIMNAAHCTPYVYRPSLPEEQRFMPLISSPSEHLGMNKKVQIEPIETRLEAGDVLFCHTDGLLSGVEDSKRPATKRELLKVMGSLAERHVFDAQELIKRFTEDYLRILRETARDRVDDIAVLAITVSPRATFGREPELTDPSLTYPRNPAKKAA